MSIELLLMRKRPRVERARMEGRHRDAKKRKKRRCIMYIYQFPMINIIIYCKHTNKISTYKLNITISVYTTYHLILANIFGLVFYCC